jgi:MFS family permease
MKIDKSLWTLVFICVINSLGFGIIVPLMYTFGKRYGINEQSLSWLTAAYSVAQLIATPILGSLSDRYGRKPLLAISLIGTCISFIMFAEARGVIMLFAARILDGLTGGNISVAQAIVSDTSTPANRAKRFGILSSAFAFGFVIGPAVGGLLSRFGLQAPFFFAAGISFLGVMATIFFLKETNPVGYKKEVVPGSKKLFSSFSTLKVPVVGIAIFIGFLLTMAQFTMIIGFQTFTVDTLKLSPNNIGLLYTGFAAMGIIMQLCIPLFTKLFHSRTVILLISTFLCFAAMFFAGFTATILTFAVCIGIYGLFNGLRNPMLNAIIADNNTNKSQGAILGFNQSCASIGQTVGPIAAGFITLISIHAVFFLSSFFILIAFLFTFRLRDREHSLAARRTTAQV